MAQNNQDQGEFYAFFIIGFVVLAVLYFVVAALAIGALIMAVIWIVSVTRKYVWLGTSYAKIMNHTPFVYGATAVWSLMLLLFLGDQIFVQQTLKWAWFTNGIGRNVVENLNGFGLMVDNAWQWNQRVAALFYWSPIVLAPLPLVIYGKVMFGRHIREEASRRRVAERTAAATGGAFPDNGVDGLPDWIQAGSGDKSYDFDPNRFTDKSAGGGKEGADQRTQERAYKPASASHEVITVGETEDATDARLWAVAEDPRTSEEERQAAMRALRKRGGRKR